jgi:hypothetical protein
MDLKTITESAPAFLAGGAFVALSYIVWAGYRISDVARMAKEDELLRDYKNRICNLPDDEKIRLIGLHYEGTWKRKPTKENLPAIEAKLKKRLEKPFRNHWVENFTCYRAPKAE